MRLASARSRILSRQLHTLDRAIASRLSLRLLPLAHHMTRTLQQAALHGPGAVIARYKALRPQWLMSGNALVEDVVRQAIHAARVAFMRWFLRRVGKRRVRVLLAAEPTDEEDDLDEEELGQEIPDEEEDEDYPGIALALADLTTAFLYYPDPWGMTPLQRLTRQEGKTYHELFMDLLRAPSADQAILLALGALALARGTRLKEAFRDVERAVRSAFVGNPAQRQRVLDALREARKNTRKETGVSARDIRELERVIERGREAVRDDAIALHLEERALRRVEVLARTLATRAFGETVIALAKKAGVEFVQWNLSPAHPHIDVCDGFASEDYGYGPGVYPLADLPPYPAHAFCLCELTPIMRYRDITEEVPTVEELSSWRP